MVLTMLEQYDLYLAPNEQTMPPKWTGSLSETTENLRR